MGTWRKLHQRRILYALGAVSRNSGFLLGEPRTRALRSRDENTKCLTAASNLPYDRQELADDIFWKVIYRLMKVLCKKKSNFRLTMSRSIVKSRSLLVKDYLHRICESIYTNGSDKSFSLHITNRDVSDQHLNFFFYRINNEIFLGII